MRILLLAPQPFFQERGTPIAVRLLATELARLGHSVDLLVFHEGEQIAIEGVRIVRTWRVPGLRGIRPGFSLKKVVCDGLMLVRAVGMRLRCRYDLVHAVEESAAIALLLRGLFGTPYVCDMDSSMPAQMADRVRLPRLVRGLLERAERGLIRGSLGVVAVCEALADVARAVDGAKPVLVLEDPSLLQPVSEGPDLRMEFGIDGPMLMYVGNLEPYQGIELLLRAFALAWGERPGARLVVIGGSEGHVGHYRGRAAELGVAEAVCWAGPRPVAALGWYLGQADIVVSPRTEGGNTPMKIYSYLDCGRAVLATDLPTHTQVLDGSIAELAPPEARPFGEAMVRLIDDPARREGLAAAARQRVAERYSVEAYRRKLGGFYGMMEAGLADRRRVDA